MLNIEEVRGDGRAQKHYLVINHQLGGTGPSNTKELWNGVTVLLRKICHLSWKTATELEDWKAAKVIPIFLIGLKVIPEIIHLWAAY